MRHAVLLAMTWIGLSACAGHPPPPPPTSPEAQRAAEETAEDQRRAAALARAGRAQIIGMYMPAASALARCPDPADRREAFVLLQDMEFAAQALIRADPTLAEILGAERAAGERRINRAPTATECARLRSDLDKSVAWLRTSRGR